MHMRLQSAIFTVEDTLAGDDADKVLSILKMEGVWLYAVTALPREDAERLLREAGAEDYFRGLLAAPELGCSLGGAELYERAMRRLRSQPRDTIVFTGSPEALRGAKAAGLRVAAVKGAAAEGEWDALRAEADEVVERYADFLL